MKKIFNIAILLLIMSATAGVAVADPGKVWAVDNTGDRSDYFSLGTYIFINGENFNTSVRYGWTITDQDNDSFVKPIVAENSTILYTNSTTGCIDHVNTTWHIPFGDYQSHDYRLNVQIYEPKGDSNSYKEFYTKRDSFNSIPEFSTIALPMLSILGLMFILSRKRK